MNRNLYLIAYDVTHSRRRRFIHTLLKTHATGGQKSFYECFFTSGELQRTLHELNKLIDPEEDRVLVIRLDDQAKNRALGIGIPPTDDVVFYQG